MKILILAPYIYCSNYPEHCKNKTGFGMMVMDIINSLCERGNDVYVLTHTLGPKRQTGKRLLCRHTFYDVFVHMSISLYFEGLSSTKKMAESKNNSLRSLYYYLDKGYVRYCINKIKPDIVHIHGIGLGTKNYIDVCEELGVPFVVTAHGLIRNDPYATELDRAIELEFFRRSETESIHVTVISTGIKQRLLESYYGLKSTGNVTVVLNGTDVRARRQTEDIKLKYGIGSDGKLCIAVGSVCEIKNQIQIVRAFALIPEKIRSTSILIIIGSISEDYPIKNEIEKLGLSDKVLLTGFVSKDELCNHYIAADLNILASKDEGFGLSIIEGFVYGVPCIAFESIDSIQDLYHKEAMLLCNEQSEESLADTIESALNKSWDREWIKQYSHNYSLPSMVKKYEEVFDEVISGH